MFGNIANLARAVVNPAQFLAPTSAIPNALGGLAQGASSFSTGAGNAIVNSLNNGGPKFPAPGASASGDSGLAAAGSALGQMGQIRNQMNAIQNSNMSPEQKQHAMMQLQQKMQSVTQILQMISKIMQNQHSVAMAIIGNLPAR